MTLTALPAAAAPTPTLRGRWRAPAHTDSNGVRTQCGFEADDDTMVLSMHATYLGMLAVPLAFSSRYYFEYVIAGVAYNTADLYELNQVFRRQTLIPLTEGMVNMYNRDRKCGIADWTLGSERDVTGRDCGEDGAWPRTAETRVYNLVQFDVTDLHFGYFPPGDDLVGRDAGHRPREVDLNAAFMLQH
jgi:hypothetical protein